jgi:hypothetical protein
MFNSNIHARKKEFHVYNTNDLSLEAIGMCSYTQSSISGYLSRTTDEELKKYFNNESLNAIKDKLMGQIGSSFKEEPTILRFNKETKEYDLVTGASIFQTIEGVSVASTVSELLEKHNKVQYGSLTDGTVENIKEVVKNIQTSLSGCITFRPEFNVLGCPRSPQIKLYLKDRFANDNTRTIAQRGSPLIVDVPRRTTSVAYGARGTENAPQGVYQNQSEGGVDNPNNTVAAPLDIRYNSALGKWQGGTHQILARLLTDVDPAPINNLDLSSLDTGDASFYDPNSSNYISQFSTGMALPLSVESANPYQFGPNIIGCVDENGNLSNAKLEKILVVNRAARSFKKGDVVLCSHIDNEWIVQGFDAGTITKPKGKVGRWQFQKFIATHATFFKGYTTGNSEVGTNPDLIESKIRTRYYQDMLSAAGDSSSPYSPSSPHLDGSMNPLSDIAKLNLYITSNPLTDEILNDIIKLYDWQLKALAAPIPAYDNFYPYNCAQASIFDQLSSDMGGTNTFGTVIGRTVPDELTIDSDTGLSSQSNLPVFWGPAFPDGYSSQQVSSLKQSTFTRFDNPKTTPSGLPWIVTDPAGNESFPPQSPTSKIYFNGSNIDIFSTGTMIKNKALSLFATTTDGNAKQLPAEVALNGCLQSSTYAYPIEHIYVPKNVNTIDAYTQHLKGYNSIDTSHGAYARYNYLLNIITNNTGGKTDLTYKDIALSPVQPNKIQFSPLQLEFATSSLLTNDDAFSEVNQLIGDLKDLYDSSPSLSDLFGDFIGRNENLIPGGTSFKSYPNALARLPFYTLGDALYQDGKKANVLSKPIGSPFNKIDRSNIIGIIASKNRFSSSSNGSVTFTTRQMFGLGPKVTIAGGQGPQLTFLGAFLGWTDPGNPLQNNSIPQWGDVTRTDNYNSTGTTALHVRIFDQWPDAQTIYLGHCFSALHFNPITEVGPTGEFTKYRPNGVRQILKDRGEASQRWVDASDTSVDFRVPTYKNYNTVPHGTIFTINSETQYKNRTDILAPTAEWNINPIRRFALLTKGGFVYYRRVIGVNGSGEGQQSDGGANYVVGDIVNGDKGSKLKVTAVNDTGAITQANIIDGGQGFLPSDFTKCTINNRSDYCIIMSVSGGSGQGGKVYIKNLEVYYKLYYDTAPQERVGITRLTLPSYEGKKWAEGSLDTTVSLEGGNGKYDAFYFFHNDILHTLMGSTPFTAGNAQTVNLEISTG